MIMIKISVIIPIYNMGRYLEECLDSVIAQTLEEIEVICINDGSQDNSMEILEKYAGDDDRIIIINQDNMGAGKARNRGIDAAEGEFIAFMDPDDWYPGKDVLSYLYQTAKRENVKICGGLIQMYNDVTENIMSNKDERLDFCADYKILYRDYQYCYYFQRFIYESNFIQENKIYFPSYSRFQDPPFLATAMICAEKLFICDKVVYNYRVGHKRIKWTVPQIMDAVRGMRDVLAISYEKQLPQLHSFIINIIFNEFYSRICFCILVEESLISDLLYQIDQNIDMELLNEGNDTVVCKPYFDMETIKNMTYGDLKEKMLSRLQGYENIIIYGAGVIGKEVISFLQAETEIQIKYIAVSDKEINVSKIGGIKVKNIEELISYRENALILIATNDKLHSEIENTLQMLGYKHIMPINYYREFEILKLLNC